jgi:hypothetical protein
MQRSPTNIKTVLQECKGRKNVCMLWIYYQKVFDKVPLYWIIISLELIGIDNKTISFTKKSINYWNTSTHLHREEKLVEKEDVAITSGIFQEDSSSPLPFFTNLISLTQQLNKLNTEYEERTLKIKLSQ